MPRILIVDDDQAIQEYVLETARSLGYGAWACSSAEEALAFVRDWHPDVVITDYELLGTDGLGLAVKLRGEYETLAVLMSGNPDAGNRAREVGIGFIGKPFNIQELRRLLGAWNSESRVSRTT
ncbi:MAG: response regulator [Acidobacteria bacterium]|nr:response regulator [Acidobacteriota bacterium]